MRSAHTPITKIRNKTMPKTTIIIEFNSTMHPRDLDDLKIIIESEVDDYIGGSGCVICVKEED